MVSKVDVALLSHQSKHRAIQNLGGIGNLTYLPPRSDRDWSQKIRGWDTGPANVLIDLAIQQLTAGEKTYDRNGESGFKRYTLSKISSTMARTRLLFTISAKIYRVENSLIKLYLDRLWQDARAENVVGADWLATVSELTVASIAHSYRTFLPRIPDEILLCGGGSHNLYLRQRLQAELTSAKILTTDEVGLNGDYKEAIAFAILAYWRYYCNFPGNYTPSNIR